MADSVWSLIVLAGGSSSRIGGADKAQLVFDGRTLLERICDDTPRGVEILVAGPSAPQPFLQQLSNHGVRHLTWERHDSRAAAAAMRTCLGEARVCFLPHQEPRAGFQFVLQSMAAGRPVVGTARSTEGLLFTPGRDIWMDDEPDAFTSDLVRLLRAPELRRQTVENATETVKAHYEWNAARSSLSELLQEL